MSRTFLFFYFLFEIVNFGRFGGGWGMVVVNLGGKKMEEVGLNGKKKKKKSEKWEKKKSAGSVGGQRWGTQMNEILKIYISMYVDW